MFFDQNYSAEVQRKRKKVWEVIKELSAKNIRAQSPYPAQLNFTLGTVGTFKVTKCDHFNFHLLGTKKEFSYFWIISECYIICYKRGH